VTNKLRKNRSRLIARVHASFTALRNFAVRPQRLAVAEKPRTLLGPFFFAAC